MQEPAQPPPGGPSARARAAFATYLAAANTRPGVWRVFATLLILIAAQVLAMMAIGLLAAAAGDRDLSIMRDPRGQLMATLATLATAPLALALALNLLHGRPLSSLLSAAGRLERAPLILGALAAAALSATGLALSTAFGLARVTPIEGYAPPWILLISAFALIPAQAAGEELVFRGYLLQEIGRRLPYALAWAGLPSALFAWAHAGGGQDPVETAAYVGSTFLFGLFAAALVWRSAGLSAAIGFHVANNWVAICLFEPPQGVEGLGPLAVRFEPGGALPSLAIDAALLMLALALLWRLLPPPTLKREPTHDRTGM